MDKYDLEFNISMSDEEFDKRTSHSDFDSMWEENFNFIKNLKNKSKKLTEDLYSTINIGDEVIIKDLGEDSPWEGLSGEVTWIDEDNFNDEFQTITVRVNFPTADGIREVEQNFDRRNIEKAREEIYSLEEGKRGNKKQFFCFDHFSPESVYIIESDSIEDIQNHYGEDSIIKEITPIQPGKESLISNDDESVYEIIDNSNDDEIKNVFEKEYTNLKKQWEENGEAGGELIGFYFDDDNPLPDTFEEYMDVVNNFIENSYVDKDSSSQYVWYSYEDVTPVEEMGWNELEESNITEFDAKLDEKRIETIELPHEEYTDIQDIIRVNEELDRKAKAGKLLPLRKEKDKLMLSEPEINGIWTLFLNDRGGIVKITLW